MNTSVEEHIMRLHDAGKSLDEIQAVLSPAEQDSAASLLQSLALLHDTPLILPAQEVLSQAVVTPTAPNRLIVSTPAPDDRTRLSWVHSFITYCTMHKPIAIGTSSMVALLLVIGGVAYYRSGTPIDPTVAELSWAETYLDEDVALLDAFLDEGTLDDDLLVLSELDDASPQGTTAERDLDTFEAELEDAFADFSTDEATLDAFDEGTGDVEDDLSTLS